MFQAHYAEDGTIQGFYIPGLHRDIPSPTIEITAEQHADYFARGQNYKVINGIWTYVEPVESEQQIVTPPVDHNIADLWQAMLAISAELEALKGGI